jgi:hypothetical protein
MLKKIGILTFAITILLLSALFIPGCSRPAQSSLPEPSYSREITENVMLAINSNDFSKYSRDFDPTMKQAMTQQAFEQVRTSITSKIGMYVPGSLQFSQAILQTNYIVIIYTCKFADEPGDVTITISFQSIDGNNLVAGLYFNSPKLRN